MAEDPAKKSSRVSQIQGTVAAQLEAHQSEEDRMLESVEAAIPCSTPITDLRLRLLAVVCEINSTICTQKRGRDGRFFVQGLYNGPGLLDDEGGNVCVNEDAAVVFEPTVSEDERSDSSTNLKLLYGNIQEMTAKGCGKVCTVQKLHLQEGTAAVWCKWYKPVMVCGKHAFTLSVIEQEGFNDTVSCEAMLTAVRMLPDEQHGCLLLVDMWVAEEVTRTVAHKRLAAAQDEHERRQIGVYKKPIRRNHDQVKSQMLFHDS